MAPPAVAEHQNRRARSWPWHLASSRPSMSGRTSIMCWADVYLYEIAHSRAGDKGDVSNISLIAYHEDFYPLLVQEVTPERVRAHFDGMIGGRVERYELPLIGALNFVLH